MKQCFGVMRRKQSPLFRELAVGSIKRTWTCLRPTNKAVYSLNVIQKSLIEMDFLVH